MDLIKGPGRGFFKRNTMGILNYINETRAEMRHVNWPTRKQTVSFTVLVIVFSLGVAFFLGLFDFLFARLLEVFIL